MGLQILPRHMLAMVIVVALMVISPLLFDQMEGSVTYSETKAAATGTLTFSGNTSDGEMVNISTDTYEFDVAGDGVGAGHLPVLVSGGLNNTTMSASTFATEVGNNDTVGVGASAVAGVVTLTADSEGTAGNVATTETCANAAFGAATLAGGLDGSRWDSQSVGSSVTDQATTWGTIVNLIVLMVTIVLIGLGLRYLLVYLGVV